MPGLRSVRVRLLGALSSAGLIALLISGISSANPQAGTPAKPVSITVTIRDSAFALSKKTAPAGSVTFVVRNAGKLSHTFQISAKKTPVLKPGKQAKLVVTFKKAGKFTYTSTLAGQAKSGLKGTFTVTQPVAATPGDPVAGKAVFTGAGGCNACHTLEAADASGTIGPNLDQVSLPFATIVSTVTNGKNGSDGAMPPFKSTLTAKQIQDVAAFVYASEHP